MYAVSENISNSLPPCVNATSLRTLYKGSRYSRHGLVGNVLAYLHVRPEFKSQVRHQNENMKIFLRRLPLSADFWQKFCG